MKTTVFQHAAKVIGNHCKIKSAWGKLFFKLWELGWNESNDKSLCPSMLSWKYELLSFIIKMNVPWYIIYFSNGIVCRHCKLVTQHRKTQSNSRPGSGLCWSAVKEAWRQSDRAALQALLCPQRPLRLSACPPPHSETASWVPPIIASLWAARWTWGQEYTPLLGRLPKSHMKVYGQNLFTWSLFCCFYVLVKSLHLTGWQSAQLKISDCITKKRERMNIWGECDRVGQEFRDPASSKAARYQGFLHSTCLKGSYWVVYDDAYSGCSLKNVFQLSLPCLS